MKIGTKHIVLFVVALSFVVIGYKYNDIANLLNSNTGINSPGSTDSEGDDAEDVFVESMLYFSENRLERDTNRGRIKETLEAITKDENASGEVKAEAYEKIIDLGELKSIETNIEGLIREKGFADAYACFSDHGEMDVLIKTDSLTEEQVVRVTDIIIRHSNLEYKDIHIRCAHF